MEGDHWCKDSKRNTLLVKIFYFDTSGAMCCDELCAACHPCTLVAEYHTGTSDSVQNFKPVVRKVSPQHFLPILGAPQPKITNPFFLTSCDQMVLLTGVRPKPGFRHFEVRPWVKFSKFWPGETSDLYANGSESFPPGFFTPFWGPMAGNYESVFSTGVQQIIYVRSFWPLCDQEKGLKNPRRMAG